MIEEELLGLKRLSDEAWEFLEKHPGISTNDFINECDAAKKMLYITLHDTEAEKILLQMAVEKRKEENGKRNGR